MNMLRVSLAVTCLAAANVVGLMLYHHAPAVQRRNTAMPLRPLPLPPPTLRPGSAMPQVPPAPAVAPTIWRGPEIIDTHPTRALDLEHYPDPEADLHFGPVHLRFVR